MDELNQDNLNSEAFRDLENDSYESQTEREAMDEPEPGCEHGTPTGYRCNKCVEEQSQLEAELQAGFIDAVNKLTATALETAVGEVDPVRAGVLQQVLEERRAK